MKYMAALILFLSGSLTNAQDNFLAYRVTGGVTWLDNNKEMPLKVGKILKRSASVKLRKNAHLLLICGNSSTAVALQEGTYSLEKLAGNCVSAQHSLTSNYFHYVWWQLTNPNVSVKEEQQKNMGWSGAVTRGCPGIEFLSPDTVGFFSENVILKWEIGVPFKTREFVLYAFADSPVPLLKIPLKSGYLHLDNFKDKLEVSTEYFWTIRLDGKENCPRKLLQVWGKDDFTLLTDSINKSLVPGMDEAEKEYMTGWLFEQHHLPGEAYRHYKLAAAAAPGNNRYKKTVKRFRS